MVETIGRPLLARLFASVMSLVTLAVILQGVLFGGFYRNLSPDSTWMDVHSFVGIITVAVVVLILAPLSYLARFPRNTYITVLTFALAVAWILTYELGREIEDERTLAMVHIPLAVAVFGLSGHLTGRSFMAIRRSRQVLAAAPQAPAAESEDQAGPEAESTTDSEAQ